MSSRVMNSGASKAEIDDVVAPIATAAFALGEAAHLACFGRVGILPLQDTIDLIRWRPAAQEEPAEVELGEL
jgi:hypothetical protein